MMSLEVSRESTGDRGFIAVTFLAFHVPLALLMQSNSAVATLHALAVLAIGGWWAMFGELDQVAVIGAYIVGAEVLWRMSDAHIFWEFGKYATATIFAVALLRRRLYGGAARPLLYFLLLLPSTVLTMLHLDRGEAMEQIRFNLAGPFALMMCAWFFSSARLSSEQLRRLFLMMMGPIVGIATLALSSTLAVTPGQFGGGSTSMTSGGFGPNQVSAVLGLGGLAALFYTLYGGARRALRVLAAALLLAFLAQGALTFSRGGVLGAVGAVLLALPFLLRDASTRRTLGVLAILLAVAVGVMLPRLDAFTGGALATRYEDVNPSGRDVMVQADLQTWLEHPIFGVGPGRSREQREAFSGEPLPAAHTEYSRMLAEHGILGVLAAVMLIVIAVQNFKQARAARARALVASMAGWSLLFMLHSATRLVAPAFAFGLTSAALFSDEEKSGLFRPGPASSAADASSYSTGR